MSHQSSFPAWRNARSQSAVYRKSHAMAGWRLGWMIGPPELAYPAGQLALCSTYGIPTFLQNAAVVALEYSLNGIPQLQTAYRHRRDRLCDRLEVVSVLSCHRPDGGMFVMLDARATGRSTYDFARGLVLEEGVAILPADEFARELERLFAHQPWCR